MPMTASVQKFRKFLLCFDREQLDEEIVKAAESVAEELKGDPGQTKIDLLSRIKYQAHMTMEQKLGKSPQHAVPIEDKSAVE